MGYSSTVAQAQKILGDKANIPKTLSASVLKANKDSEASITKYEASVKQLEATILALQNSASAIYNSGKQFADQIEGSDFGMDTKDADYKKKRAAAQKLFDAYFDDGLKNAQDTIKALDELDKHLMNLKGYKSPPDPLTK